MPGIDGFEFAETIREQNKTIPILLITSRDNISSKQRGFRIGIDDYMVKPFDMDEMVLRVCALLRRANIVSEWSVKGNVLATLLNDSVLLDVLACL